MVEELKPQLKIDAFAEMGVLVRSNIGLGERRLPELLGLFIAVRAWGGRGELSRRKHAVQIRASRSALVITGHVGEVQVISIRVVISPLSKGRSG